MTYHDMLEICEYMDAERKESPNYTPSESDNQKILKEAIEKYGLQ